MPLLLPFLLIGVLATAGPLRAQQPTASASVSADSVTVGERFTLTLTARHADSLEAHFPDPARGDTLLGDLVVIARTDVTSEAHDDGARRNRARYEVTTFALDTAYVPPLPVRLTGSRDTTLALSSMVRVPVRSLVPSGASGLQGLAPLAAFPRPWWFWVLVVLTPLALLALAYYLWRRRQSAGEAVATEPPPEPPEPPYESARRRLRELEATTDWDAPDERKPFYVELADVARTYLKRRLEVAALESTTGELMRRLEDQVGRGRMPGEARDQLGRMLKKADQVKFANRQPGADVSRRLLETTGEALHDIEERQRQNERERRRERQHEQQSEQRVAAAANDPTA